MANLKNCIYLLEICEHLCILVQNSKDTKDKRITGNAIRDKHFNATEKAQETLFVQFNSVQFHSSNNTLRNHKSHENGSIIYTYTY